jgi:hypothetical protein
MKEKSLYDRGFETGYLLGKSAPHVIEIALKELRLPAEFLTGMRKGREEGERDKKAEEHQKRVADDREYLKSVLNEQKKQKDYDKLPEEQKILKTNKKKAEDLKFKQLQETKELVTDPEAVGLSQWADKKVKEINGDITQAPQGDGTDEKDKPSFQIDGTDKDLPELVNSNVSREQMRMQELAEIRASSECRSQEIQMIK